MRLQNFADVPENCWKLTARDFEDAATRIQAACNASGILFSLHSVTDRIRDEAWAARRGGSWIAHHPILALHLHQLCHLGAIGEPAHWRGEVEGVAGYTWIEAVNHCKSEAARRRAKEEEEEDTR